MCLHICVWANVWAHAYFVFRRTGYACASCDTWLCIRHYLYFSPCACPLLFPQYCLTVTIISHNHGIGQSLMRYFEWKNRVCTITCMYWSVCGCGCVFMFVYADLCKCKCVCVCVFIVCTHVQACMFVCVCVYIYMYVCVCVCIYIYIYIYVQILDTNQSCVWIYVYIYTPQPRVYI